MRQPFSPGKKVAKKCGGFFGSGLISWATKKEWRPFFPPSWWGKGWIKKGEEKIRRGRRKRGRR